MTFLPVLQSDPQKRSVDGAWTLQLLGPLESVRAALDAFMRHPLQSFATEAPGSKVLVNTVQGPTSTFDVRYTFVLQPCGVLQGDLLALVRHAVNTHPVLEYDGSVSCPAPLFPDPHIQGQLPNRAAVMEELKRRENAMGRRYLKLGPEQKRAEPKAVTPERKRAEPESAGASPPAAKLPRAAQNPELMQLEREVGYREREMIAAQQIGAQADYAYHEAERTRLVRRRDELFCAQATRGARSAAATLAGVDAPSTPQSASATLGGESPVVPPSASPNIEPRPRPPPPPPRPS
jgi:hypothetical protein